MTCNQRTRRGQGACVTCARRTHAAICATSVAWLHSAWCHACRPPHTLTHTLPGQPACQRITKFVHYPSLCSVRTSVSSSSAAPAEQGGSSGTGLWHVLSLREAARLLTSAWQLLTAWFWPVIIIYALKDSAAFVLHRVGHRITNAGASSAQLVMRTMPCMHVA